MRSRALRALLAALLALLSAPVLPGAPAAEAHAYLVRSEPAGNSVLPDTPATVQLWYSEEPEPRFTEVSIYNTARVRVQQPAVQVAPEDRRLIVARLAPLQPGVYTVVWRALSSVDGHTTAGAFAFAVGVGQEVTGPVSGLVSAGQQTTRPDPPGVIARWLTYLGLAALLGALAFPLLVAEPALAALRGRHPASAEWIAETRVAMQRRSLQLAMWAVWLSVGAAGLSAVVQAARAAGLPLGRMLSGDGVEALRALLLETRYGQVWFGRLLMLVLLAFALSQVRAQRAVPAGRARAMWQVGAVFAALYPLTVSLNSHAAAVSPSTPGAPFLPIFADWVHLVTTGLWVGGLLQLVLTLPAGLRAAGSGRRRAVLAQMVPQFSVLAAASLAVLAITGTYQAVLLVGSVAALFGTDYGRVLVAKLALVTPLVLLGAFNHFISRPRLARAGDPGAKETAGPDIARVFRIAVGSEAAIGAAVLLSVGILTLHQPARDAWAQATRGVTQERSAQDLRLRLRVNPGEPGFNAVSLRVQDRNGRTVERAEKVALILSHLEHEMGENELVLEPQGGGVYSGESGLLSMVGKWRAEALVRRSGRDDVRAPFEFELVDLNAPAGGQTGTTDQTPGTSINGTPIAPAAARQLRNPIVSNPDSVARGQALYQQNCIVCHGVTGKGDGPAARTLRPPPADLGQHVTQHTEGELWWWITNGIQGTAMPAWRASLNDTERWHLVNYIVSAFGVADR